MKQIAVTLLARDERDIVDAWLAHYAKYPDVFVLATDNGSNDGTREILANSSLVRELIDEPAHDYAQWRWVTRMARRAAELGCGWVVHTDADEFWTGLNQLAAVPPRISVIYAEHANHLPLATSEHRFDPASLPYYVMTEFPENTDTPPKVAHRASATAVVAQGNHAVTGVPGSVARLPGMLIHHYPVRSYAQFEKKVKQGGEAYLRYQGPTRHGSHWKRWYQEYLAGRLPDLYASFVFHPTAPLPSGVQLLMT